MMTFNEFKKYYQDSRSIRLIIKIILATLLVISLALLLNWRRQLNLDEYERAIYDKRDLIRVFTPKPYEKITSPLVIKGEARKDWFSENFFLVYLLDDKGEEWMIGIAEAQKAPRGKFVPFEAKIDWQNPSANFAGERKDPLILNGRPGLVVLKKTKTGNILENNDELRIPIIFHVE